MKRIAVVAAKGLGDGLICTVLAHHFALTNHCVTLFNTPLTQLASWFPRLQIAPFPKEFDFASFDLVYSQDHTPLSHLQDPRLHIFKEDSLDKKKTLAQNFASFCAQHFPTNLNFGLSSLDSEGFAPQILAFAGKMRGKTSRIRRKRTKDASKHPEGKGVKPKVEVTNGLIIPTKWQKGKYPKRIVLHPTASEPKRMWCLKKFQIVAYKLQKSGWHPIFCLSPEEAIEYQDQLAPIYICNTLNDLAGFMAESGSFIGNNSGPGHLASAIGLPTISLFSRKSYSHLWRPAWGDNTVVTPLPFLLGSHAKYHHWQTFLTTSQVTSAFFKRRS